MRRLSIGVRLTLWYLAIFAFAQLVFGAGMCFILQQLNVNSHVYTVEMGVPADDAVETLHLFRSYMLVFAPLLLLVAAGGGYWLSRRALCPVDALVRTARQVSGTNLHSRLQKL